LHYKAERMAESVAQTLAESGLKTREDSAKAAHVPCKEEVEADEAATRAIERHHWLRQEGSAFEHTSGTLFLKTPNYLSTPTPNTSKPLTGGSSDYYKLVLENEREVECQEIIEALNLNFSEGNILKALWRQAAKRLGNGKAGTTAKYDREKIVFFGNRLLAQAI
jgi:hypothetical protein